MIIGSKIIKTLEALCPFCGNPNTRIILVLAKKEAVEKRRRAITDIPCEKCKKYLESSDVGFITDSGEGFIVDRKTAIEILARFKKIKLYKPKKVNIFRVSDKFLEIIKKQSSRITVNKTF